MSTDMHGYVEVLPWTQYAADEPRRWIAAIDVDLLAWGESDGFGCLFGVRNGTGLTPLAARRGIPVDVSDAVREFFDELDRDYPGEAHSHSWLTWAELETLDWNGKEGVDERLHRFRRGPDGQWTFVSKASWSNDFEDVAGFPQPHTPPDGWPEGVTWEREETRFTAVRLSWRDVLEEPDWASLWDAMRLLARLHGSDNVRLTVCFSD